MEGDDIFDCPSVAGVDLFAASFVAVDNPFAVSFVAVDSPFAVSCAAGDNPSAVSCAAGVDPFAALHTYGDEPAVVVQHFSEGRPHFALHTDPQSVPSFPQVDPFPCPFQVDSFPPPHSCGADSFVLIYFVEDEPLGLPGVDGFGLYRVPSVVDLMTASFVVGLDPFAAVPVAGVDLAAVLIVSRVGPCPVQLVDETCLLVLFVVDKGLFDVLLLA